MRCDTLSSAALPSPLLWFRASRLTMETIICRLFLIRWPSSCSSAAIRSCAAACSCSSLLCSVTSWIHGCTKNVRFLLHRGRRPYMAASQWGPALHSKTGRIHGCTRTLRKTSDSSCTAGAVHTWPFASFRGNAALRSVSDRSGHQTGIMGTCPSITVVIFRWRICLISESMGHHDLEIMDDRGID